MKIAPEYAQEIYPAQVCIEDGGVPQEYELIIQPLDREFPGVKLQSLRKKIVRIPSFMYCKHLHHIFFTYCSLIKMFVDWMRFASSPSGRKTSQLEYLGLMECHSIFKWAVWN